LAFCLKFPATDIAPNIVEMILSELTPSDDDLVDFAVRNQRVAVGALVSTVDNRDGSADFLVLGWDSKNCGACELQRMLHRAEARWHTSQKPILDVPLYAATVDLAPLLADAGFGHSYSTFDMECASEEATIPEVTVPARFRWEHWSAATVEDYHRVVRLAFTPIPGASISPLPTFKRLCEAEPIAPQLLLEGERIVGFARVSVESPETGVVQNVGRDPAYRAQGLGKVLLQKALAMLRIEGVSRYKLSVAIANEAALRLYRDFGFEVIRRNDTWRKSRG